MKFDRNTVLGFSILAVLFVLLFVFNSQNQKEQLAETQRKDSLANLEKKRADSLQSLHSLVDTSSLRAQQAVDDSLSRVKKDGKFRQASGATEEFLTVTNDLFTIRFSNKGAQPRSVELSHFKDMDSGHVKLAARPENSIAYRINTGAGSTANTDELYFANGRVEKKADGTQVVSYDLIADSTGQQQAITHQYVIRKDDYMIDFNIIVQAPQALFDQGTINLTWNYVAAQQESSISFEKQNTQIGYVEDGDFDYHTIGKKTSVTLDGGPVKWVGVRQRFFNTFLVAGDNFSSGTMEWTVPTDSTKNIVHSTANMKLKLAAANRVTVPLNIFYGPSDFKILKQHDLKFEKLVNLGQGMYAFVRPLNQFIVNPVWNLLKGLFSSYGLVIALLTLFIRLVISPLSYKSYLSGAKMKALRPEIAKLKERLGGDQQQMSVEQMKLFREAGVNPLGGCIPALLQIPIFFALYSFFNSNVDLRGADFLWSKDLSAYDSVLHFENVPVLSYLLNGHLSLFTITAVITSLLISVYSMSLSPDQSNPLMKYMPYIFPIFLLFIFNSLPSALTWYYTVSNIITLILQFVIQNYIIDHDKILVQIQENRKKPKTKSKWQERMEQVQEQQRLMKEQQQKRKR